MEKSCEKLNKQESIMDDAPASEEEDNTSIQEQESEDKTPDSCEEASEVPISSPPSVNIEEILDRFEETVASHCSELLKAFERKLALDSFKEEQIRELHNELQSYKADLLAKAIRPLVMGMIRLHEDMGKMVEFFQKSDEDKLERERVLRNFEGLREDIVEVLNQNGIIAYRESGEEFNLRRQRVLRKVPTSDPSLVGRVAEPLRYGFEQGDMIIQKEAVAVYVLAEETPPEASSGKS